MLHELKNKPYLVFFLLSLLLVVIWFRKGLFYASGDIGFPLYNPLLQSIITRYTWWEQQGPGFNYPAVTSSFPLYALYVPLYILGFPPFIIQAVFFFLILFFSFCGTYYLSFLLVENNKMNGININKMSLFSFITAILYIFNPYTMFNVWHRFAHTTMVMIAYIPWTGVFLFLGLNRRKLKYSVYLALTSIFGAYAFGTPSFLVTWFFYIFIFYLYVSVFLKPRLDAKFSLTFLLVFLVFFVGLNLWWLYPFLTSAKGALSLSTTASGNIDSLIGVSQYFTLPYAFRGINSFFLYVQKDWNNVFTLPFFQIISWIGFLYVLTSVLIKNRVRTYYFYLLLFLFVVFVSKGSGSPFGGLIILLFKLFPALGIFRNPFEKFGILYPLAFAYLSSIGILYLLKIWKDTVKRFLVYVSLILFILIYHWPLWTGYMFGGIDRSNLVKVPTEYKDAGDWFGLIDNPNLRVLHLPLMLGDGVTYNWEYGYNGLESSPLFFPGSSISHYLGYDLVDSRLKQIAFAVRTQNHTLFNDLVKKFAINYIVIHKDVDFSKYLADDLENILEFVSKDVSLLKEKEFGKLVIYKVVLPKDALSRISYITSVVGLQSVVVPDKVESNINEGTASVLLNSSSDLGDLIKGIKVFPQFALPYPFEKFVPDNALNELAYVRFVPGSILYPIIRAKEKVIELFLADSLVDQFHLTIAGKRLNEIYQLTLNGQSDECYKYLDEYWSTMESYLPAIKNKVISSLNSTDYGTISNFQNTLSIHQWVFDEYIIPNLSGKSKDKAIEISEDLVNYSVESGLSWHYPIENAKQGVIYKFIINDESNYTLTFPQNTWNYYFKSNNPHIYLDGRELESTVDDDNNYLHLYPILLTKGEHEIFIQYISDPIALENANNEDIVLQTSDGYVYKKFPLSNVDYNSIYNISFDYFIKKGLGPHLRVDTDISLDTDFTKLTPLLNYGENPDNYDFEWKKISRDVKFSPFAKSAVISLGLSNWNNCETVLKENSNNCLDPQIYSRYSRESFDLIKNLSVTKRPGTNIFLTSILSSKSDDSQTTAINFEKINPTKYELHVDENEEGIIIFKESYNEGWKLLDEYGHELNSKHVVVNMFANGWVYNGGNQKLYIEFLPQRDLYKGLYMGIGLIILGVFLVIITRRHENNH